MSYSVKLTHSFPKQYCNSQSVAVSKLDILDVRSTEGQVPYFNGVASWLVNSVLGTLSNDDGDAKDKVQ